MHLSRFINKNRNERRKINEDFMKQFIHNLKSWRSACAEFYNQIIEGETIDLLLWIYLDWSFDDASSESTRGSTSSTSTSNSANKNSDGIKHSSFELIFNFCRDSHAVRAELGRINGIKKILELIDLDSWTNGHELASTRSQRHVEILCFTCKEAVSLQRTKFTWSSHEASQIQPD